MSATVTKAADRVHLLCRETPKPRMAKAMLADLTIREKRADYGEILRRAVDLAGLSRKEAAATLHVDEGQLGRWFSGDENPQTWRFTAHPVLKQMLLIAQAEATTGAIVRTLIEVERGK